MANISEVMQKDFLELDASTKITEAIGKLQQENERYAVIFDKRFKPAYRGILDRMLLIKSKLDPKAEIGNFVMHPPTVSIDTDIFKAAELMYHSYPCVLPVTKKDKIIGVVRAQDILSIIANMPALAKLKVAEVASSGMMVFAYNSRLGDVINEMRERHFSHAPIVDKMGKIISMFSITDLFEKLIMQPEGKRQGSGRGQSTATNTFKGAKSYDAVKDVVMDQAIGDIASVSIFTSAPTESLGRAVTEMVQHNVSDLIIAQDRKPISIITSRDLLEVLFKTKSPQYWGIQFFGCESLPGQLYDAVRQQVSEFYEKIRRVYAKDIIYFMVHIKQYEKKKESGKVKYSVHLRLALPERVFNADYAHFDLNTAVSWSVKALNSELTSFKEKTKKSWTRTGMHGKRQEHGQMEKEEIERRGKFIRSKLVKR